jgi:hypothetical protein
MARFRTEDCEFLGSEPTRLAELADEQLLLDYQKNGDPELLSELVLWTPATG